MTPPPNRVVLGYDGSPDAEVALVWTAATAKLQQMRLAVVIVATHMDPVIGHFREENDRLVEQWRLQATRALGDLDVDVAYSVEVRRGPTVPVLLRAAEDAALLVIGSQGQDLAVGTLTGSISQHVVRHAPCPVVVVRPARHPDARRIVVGVDGSVGSDSALRFACRRAAATGEELVAVHCHGRTWSAARRRLRPVATGAGSPAATSDPLLDESVARVRVDFPHVAIATETVSGSPDRVLVDHSRTASLLVVGSRGRDAFAEMLLGSVSQHVLQRAECPVAVVR